MSMSVGPPSSGANPIADQIGPGAPQTITKPSKVTDPADAERAKAAERRQAQTRQLEEIRRKGIYQYAQESKLEALKKKIEAQVRAKASPDQDEASIQNKIAEEMRAAMESAMQDAAQKAAEKGGQPPAMIIDISV